jgi:hypothetical protein
VKNRKSADEGIQFFEGSLRLSKVVQPNAQRPHAMRHTAYPAKTRNSPKSNPRSVECGPRGATLDNAAAMAASRPPLQILVLPGDLK